MRHLRFLATIIATVSLLVQPAFIAAQQNSAADLPTIRFAFTVRDVVANDRGMFSAKVVSANGAPLGSQSVSLQRDNQIIATALSESNGNVTFPGLDTGLYELNVGTSIQYVRLWRPATAPPSAISSLLLVKGQDVERAQQNFCCSLLGQEPIMIGVLIAAGIAIPLAVHESGS